MSVNLNKKTIFVFRLTVSTFFLLMDNKEKGLNLIIINSSIILQGKTNKIV